MHGQLQYAPADCPCLCSKLRIYYIFRNTLNKQCYISPLAVSKSGDAPENKLFREEAIIPIRDVYGNDAFYENSNEHAIDEFSGIAFDDD